jgi:hypothetical protein
MKAPGTVGEWDVEIAGQSKEKLECYRYALLTLREWEAFREAFGWTRIFVLEQSIAQELEKRSRVR